MTTKEQPTLDYSLRRAFDTLVQLMEGRFTREDADAAVIQLEAAKALIDFNLSLSDNIMFSREVEHLFRIPQETSDDEEQE